MAAKNHTRGKGEKGSVVNRRAAASFNHALEATAAALGIMTATGFSTSSASVLPPVSGCASADR
jgi:hypothetical protein